MPTVVAERPVLTEDAKPYWEAFLCLHLSRANTGFGPGAIPLTEIMAYADLMELAGEDRKTLVDIIRAMDSAYLSWAKEKHG